MTSAPAPLIDRPVNPTFDPRQMAVGDLVMWGPEPAHAWDNPRLRACKVVRLLLDGHFKMAVVADPDSGAELGTIVKWVEQQ